MSRGILSLPGIDHEGPRVLECGLNKGLTSGVSFKAGFDTRGDVLVENVDKDAAFNAFAESAHRFVAKEGGESVLHDSVDEKQMAEWVAKVKDTTKKPVPEEESHADPQLPVSSSDSADIITAVELERRLTKLEEIVGHASCRSDRILQQSVDATLSTIASRFQNASLSSDDFRNAQDLLSKIDRVRDKIIARKSEYDACTASSISAKVSILYDVVLSLSSVSPQIPLVIERLSRLKNITDSSSSVKEFIDNHEKRSADESASDDKAFGDASDKMKSLLQQISSDADQATEGMVETSRLMAELAGKMAEISVSL